ncbi:hypothetical protein [Nitrosomonas sp.]|uniref:hypothetical protein n=1 Tax=Nitrosomonas sp. TaxID=42353 RepID=UPI002081B267|nr:hypothetical protein [Nitrosomonas sp.]GJL74039.1 MAG: hypothetical protein NMNS02_01450 [Nitrosomonas sp.]
MKVGKVCLFVVALYLSIATVAVAGTNKKIAKCAAKNSDAARLICYDNLAKSLGVDKPKTKIITGKGKWHVREDTSVIDDSISSISSI